MLKNLDKNIRYDIRIENEEECDKLIKYLTQQDKTLKNCIQYYDSNYSRLLLVRNTNSLNSPWVLVKHKTTGFYISSEELTCEEFINKTSSLLSDDKVEVLGEVYYTDDVREVLKVLKPAEEKRIPSCGLGYCKEH